MRSDVFLPLNNINDRVCLIALIARMLRAKFVYFNKNFHGLLYFVQVSASPAISSFYILIYTLHSPDLLIISVFYSRLLRVLCDT